MNSGITLSEVTVYKGDQRVLYQLSDQWQQGSLILLTGDSGCGKSTLLHTMAGFDGSSYTGDILVNGHSLHGESMAVKAQHIGLLFQNPAQQFTMRTLARELVFALENIGLSYAEATVRMQTAVAMMEMAPFLQQDFATLSGGEKQRAALTVLLALDAPVLLLDEPFASIDPASRLFLIQKLAALRDSGKLIVVVDHELTGYATLVNRWLQMEHGQLVEQKIIELQQVAAKGSLLKPGAPKEPLFTLSQVQLFQGQRELLVPQDFVFAQGITTITGDNGVGKSTLLRALVQLQAYRGKMYYRQQKLSRYFGKQTLYRSVTLAVQQAEQQFVTLQVQPELVFPQKATATISTRQEQALLDLGLYQLLKRGLYQLSEGQKKMIQLIALFTGEQQVLLLDEPFAGLDTKACQYFVQWMQEKQAKTSFIVVSHRLEPLVGISQHHVHIANQQLQEVSEG